MRARNIETGISLEYLRALDANYRQFIDEMEGAGVRILRVNWEEFLPVSEVARLVHEYSLKPSNFTKWVRPLRRLKTGCAADDAPETVAAKAK